MAYRITIKVTKTDTNPWWFLGSELDDATAQKLALVKSNGIDILNDFTFTDTEGVFTREFEDKISANRFLVKLMSQEQFSNAQGVTTHPGGWTEEIITEEI